MASSPVQICRVLHWEDFAKHIPGHSRQQGSAGPGESLALTCAHHFQLRELLKESPVLLVPTHRSYMDFLVLSYVFFLLDVPVPIIAGEAAVRNRLSGLLCCYLRVVWCRV